MPQNEKRPTSSFLSFSVALMAALVVAFVGQQTIVVRKGYETYLALSGYGFKSWHLWEFLTWQFVQCGPMHLVLNLAGLWFIGRAVEARLGVTRFFLIYLGAGVAAAIVQGGVASAGFLLPESMESVAAMLRERWGGMFAGASAGLCGIFAIYCMLPAPAEVPVTCGNRRCWLWTALALAVFFTIYFFFPSSAEPRLDLPHLGHLAGILAGTLFARNTDRFALTLRGLQRTTFP